MASNGKRGGVFIEKDGIETLETGNDLCRDNFVVNVVVVVVFLVVGVVVVVVVVVVVDFVVGGDEEVGKR